MSDDYTSNAQGQILPQQQAALVERYDRSGAIILITGPVFSAIVSLGAYFLLPILGIPVTENGDPGSILGFLVFAALLIWLVMGAIGAERVKKRHTIPMVAQLVQKPIQQARGSIEWHRGSYKARINHRWYPSVYGKDHSNKSLSAGIYNIHYLDDPSWMLSATRVNTSSSQDHSDAFRRSVARANGFSVAMLPLNRLGWMGLLQRGRVLYHLVFGTITLIPFLVSIIMLVLIPGLVLASILLSASSPGIPTLLSVPDNNPWVVVLIPLIFILYWFVTTLRDFIAQVFSVLALLILLVIGRLGRIEGELRHYVYVVKDDDGDPASYHYYYVIGGKRFRVPEQALITAPQGNPFRAYYVPVRVYPAEGIPFYPLVNIEPVDILNQQPLEKKHDHRCTSPYLSRRDQSGHI